MEKPNQNLNSEFEKELKQLLLSVYNAANWKKIAKAHSRYDIFSHKIRAAAGEENMRAFFNQLCYSLGLQSCVEVSAELINWLDQQREQVFHALRYETTYYVSLIAEVT